MTIAHDTDLEQDRAPTGDATMTSSEVLQKAHTMAMQIEKLLMSPSCRMPSSDTFRVRLARAHALSLLDQLSELVARRQVDDRARPGLSFAEEADGSAASGVRPVNSLR